MLAAYTGILDELRMRGVTRSSNNPLSDYAEGLFCRAFGWSQKKNSTAGHDAVDAWGQRYEIKGRRLTRHNASRELSAIRRIEDRRFDRLAAVLVSEDFSIFRAAIIPYDLVVAHSKFVGHTNSVKFVLRDHVWQWPGVQDVTVELAAAAAAPPATT